MARNYGTPPSAPGRSDNRKDKDKPVKEADPSPPAQTVALFHKNAPVDVRATDMHHTLGPTKFQASPGSHNHRGGDSVLLLQGVSITGVKSGPTAVLESIIAALVALGAQDETT